MLVFTIAIAFAAGILFGLAPALRAGRVDLVTAMKSGGRAIASRAPAARQREIARCRADCRVARAARRRETLRAQPAEPAAAAARLRSRDRVLLARLNPRLAGYKPADVGVLYRKLYDRLSALPGVRSATFA